MRMMGATVGMYGDLQAIAGKSLPEIEGLELPTLAFDDEGLSNDWSARVGAHFR